MKPEFWIFAAAVGELAKVILKIVVVVAATSPIARAGDPEPQEMAKEALRQFNPLVTVDESHPDNPVVAIRFRPNMDRKLMDADLSQLKEFPALRALELPSNPITDAGLEHLAVLSQLEELNLNWTKVTAAGVIRLVKSRTQLQRLELSGVPLRDDDLAILKRLPELRVLSLRGSLVTDAGLVHLATLRNLRRLQVAHSAVTDAGLEHLHGLSKLKGLNVGNTKVTQQGIDQLTQRLPGLNERPPQVVREEVIGGIAFPPKDRSWLRITGKVQVLDAHTLVFEDGTVVDLTGGMQAPELAQKGLIGDSFYACGEEAAAFLKTMIGDLPVVCYANPDHVAEKKIRVGSTFVGELVLNSEMIRNGWAISHHSLMDPWEIIARENKRGLWRGKFVVPEKWLKGERLPGEVP